MNGGMLAHGTVTAEAHAVVEQGRHMVRLQLLQVRV